MEVIAGATHVAFPMDDPSRLGEARRHLATLAREGGFDEVEAGRVAIAVNELGNNLLRHARGGQLLVAARPAECELELIAYDTGPGIADVGRCLEDGFSTGGTPGTGLGAVRRLAQVFELHSGVPAGTVVLARFQCARGIARAAARRPAGAGFAVGGLALPAPGEQVCGDAWAVACEGDRAAVVMADGLGHGPDAARASQEALAVFREQPFASPRTLLQEIHLRLRHTRGAAVSVFQADAATGVIRSAGAGNVLARLVSGVTDRTLLSQHGTAGVTIRTPEETSTPWPPHAMLVVCTDGLETRWRPELLHPVLGADPVVAAAVLLRDHSRGRDDATVAVLRRA